MDASRSVPPSPTPRWRQRTREWVPYAVFFAALLAGRSSLADHYFVPTGSMQPTVQIGDHVLVNKTAYAVRVPFTDRVALHRQGPHRGDVVILRSPTLDRQILLKRVVGTPGDTIAIHDGRLWLEGVAVGVTDEGARRSRDWTARRIPWFWVWTMASGP